MLYSDFLLSCYLTLVNKGIWGYIRGACYMFQHVFLLVWALNYEGKDILKLSFPPDYDDTRYVKPTKPLDFKSLLFCLSGLIGTVCWSISSNTFS